MEEAPRQLPRRAEAADRHAGQGSRQPPQEELPLEVHGAHAVPAAVHGQPEEASRGAGARGARAAPAQRPRPRSGRAPQRCGGPLLGGVRLGGGRGRRGGALPDEAQERRAAHRDRPQAGLPVQGAREAPVHGGRREGVAGAGRGALSASGAGAGAAAAGALGSARHILQQHVPGDEAVPVPCANQDQEDTVRRRDRGRGGARRRAAELREPLGARRRLLVQQRRGPARRRRAQALLNPRRPHRVLAVPAH